VLAVNKFFYQAPDLFPVKTDEEEFSNSHAKIISPKDSELKENLISTTVFCSLKRTDAAGNGKPGVRDDGEVLVRDSADHMLRL